MGKERTLPRKEGENSGKERAWLPCCKTLFFILVLEKEEETPNWGREGGGDGHGMEGKGEMPIERNFGNIDILSHPSSPSLPPSLLSSLSSSSIPLLMMIEGEERADKQLQKGEAQQQHEKREEEKKLKTHIQNRLQG